MSEATIQSDSRSINPRWRQEVYPLQLEVSEHLSQLTLGFAKLIPLNQREIFVLKGLSDGQTFYQLGMKLGMAPDSVRTSTLTSANKKLGVRDRKSAIEEAYRKGLLGIDKTKDAPSAEGIFNQAMTIGLAQIAMKLEVEIPFQVKVDLKPPFGVTSFFDVHNLINVRRKYRERVVKEDRLPAGCEEEGTKNEYENIELPEMHSELIFRADYVDENGFPPGFEDQIAQLEEKLKNPPSHDEMVAYLRERGWGKETPVNYSLEQKSNL